LAFSKYGESGGKESVGRGGGESSSNNNGRKGELELEFRRDTLCRVFVVLGLKSWGSIHRHLGHTHNANVLTAGRYKQKKLRYGGGVFYVGNTWPTPASECERISHFFSTPSTR